MAKLCEQRRACELFQDGGFGLVWVFSPLAFVETVPPSPARYVGIRDRKRSVPVPVPATTVNRTALESPPHHAPQLTWLGHACFLLQVKGVSVLTDPIFSDRCSPVQFAGPKRFMPAPLAVPSLPKVDVVIISYELWLL